MLLMGYVVPSSSICVWGGTGFKAHMDREQENWSRQQGASSLCAHLIRLHRLLDGRANVLRGVQGRKLAEEAFWHAALQTRHNDARTL